MTAARGPSLGDSGQLPAIADVVLSAESGLSGVRVGARVEVRFDLRFEVDERELEYQLWVHLVEHEPVWAHHDQSDVGLLADLNPAWSPARWSCDAGYDEAGPAMVIPAGREVVPQRRAVWVDFAAVLDHDMGVDWLWDLDDDPCWQVEIALRGNGRGEAFVSAPVLWNPRRGEAVDAQLNPMDASSVGQWRRMPWRGGLV